MQHNNPLCAPACSGGTPPETGGGRHCLVHNVDRPDHIVDRPDHTGGMPGPVYSSPCITSGPRQRHRASLESGLRPVHIVDRPVDIVDRPVHIAETRIPVCKLISCLCPDLTTRPEDQLKNTPDPGGNFFPMIPEPPHTQKTCAGPHCGPAGRHILSNNLDFCGYENEIEKVTPRVQLVI